MKVEPEEEDMPAEVDFSHGIRGKFAERMRRDVVYVPLAADVSKAFKTADEVNSALRLLIKTAAAVMPQSERKAS